MSCSKEIRFPSNWAKVQRHYLGTPKDEGLLGLEELVNWMDECGVADEITVRKYVENLQPYRSARCFCPIVPDDKLSRNLFKVLVAHYMVFIFVIDDVMEKDYSLDDMEKITNAYYQLDKKACETFPKVPSIKELQLFLKQYLPDNRITPNVVLLMDYLNRTVRVLLQHGNVSDDAIFDYRQRLSTSVSLYLQGIISEKRYTTHDTLVKVLWRRVFNGCPMPLAQYVEVSSCSLGKQQAHITAITELFILFCLYTVIINDFYSYTRESKESFAIANVVTLWLDKKEIANFPEAAPKIASILDEITKYVYKKGEKIKVENPNNFELHELLDEIGYAIAGSYFLHHHVSDRYKDSLVKFDMKELEDNDLQEWLADSDPYGWDVVKQFLYEHSTVTKNFNDILCGVIPLSVDSLHSLLNE